MMCRLFAAASNHYDTTFHKRFLKEVIIVSEENLGALAKFFAAPETKEFFKGSISFYYQEIEPIIKPLLDKVLPPELKHTLNGIYNLFAERARENERIAAQMLAAPEEKLIERLSKEALPKSR